MKERSKLFRAKVMIGQVVSEIFSFQYEDNFESYRRCKLRPLVILSFLLFTTNSPSNVRSIIVHTDSPNVGWHEKSRFVQNIIFVIYGRAPARWYLLPVQRNPSVDREKGINMNFSYLVSQIRGNASTIEIRLWALSTGILTKIEMNDNHNRFPRVPNCLENFTSHPTVTNIQNVSLIIPLPP